MMRSLYAGVTGLRNHQTKMDVIGNNIANVNTVGFKSSRVVFQDIYSQTLQNASAGLNGVDANGDAYARTAGTNPRQIGLGVSISAIDVLHTSAASAYTGAELDIAIEGDGFFVISTDGKLTYTRAGNFYLDKDKNLCTAAGGLVQGFLYELDDDGLNEVDDDGNPIWAKDSSGTGGTGGTTGDVWTRDDLANIVISDDYYNVGIGKDGTITALRRLDNQKVVIGKIATATFSNNTGLQKTGGNQYVDTINSGDPMFSTPGDNGSGTLNPGSLEMSNVDLAMEFTEMIITQRGFQANSRVITTSDSMLEELVNLKR